MNQVEAGLFRHEHRNKNCNTMNARTHGIKRTSMLASQYFLIVLLQYDIMQGKLLSITITQTKVNSTHSIATVPSYM